MGNWQLEVFKFGLYVFAPVASFIIYHKVDFFKNDLEEFERKRHNPKLLENDRQIREDKEYFMSLKEDSLRKELELQLAQATAAESKN